ncbi:MAG: MFS family permease [Halioglobus sp.]|jgi:MFS family permease
MFVTLNFRSYYKMLLSEWRNLFYFYPRYLLFGFIHTFFSGIGQTYLLAFFILSFQKEFGYSSTKMGMLSMYMSLASAFSLPYLGRLLDRVHLGIYSSFTGLLLFAGCVTVALARNGMELLLGLYFIRLSAHGLLPHIADVSIARYFTNNRGKALGISGMGTSFGEAILPLIIGQLLLCFSWRYVYAIFACCILLIFIPLCHYLIQGDDSFHLPPKTSKKPQSRAVIGVGELFSSMYFVSTLLLIMVPPFIITGILFHQGALASYKGWKIEALGSLFIGYAIFRILSGILAGVLTDRFTARRLLPFYTLPLSIGMLCLYLIDEPFAAFCFYGLAGGTLGLGTNFKGALWSEIYGPSVVGGVRSVASSAMVLATALSPPLFGLILDSGLPFSVIIWICILLVWSTSYFNYYISQHRSRKTIEV